MIPVSLLLTAMVAGFSLAMGLASLLLLRGSADRRRLAKPFCLTSLALVAFALSQAVRNASYDPTLTDVALRLLGAAIIVFAIGVLWLYLRLTACRPGWIDRLLVIGLAGCAVYSLGSSGGLSYVSLERIDTVDLAWLGPIAMPRGQADPAILAWYGGLAMVCVRLVWLSWRATDRIGSALLLLPPPLFIAAMIWGLGLMLRWWDGPPMGGYATATVYAILGVQMYRRERELHDELSRRQRQIDAMMEHGLGLAGLLDREGRVVLSNRASLAMGGVSAADVLGRPFVDTPWWRHNAEARARLQQAIASAAAGTADRFTTTHVRTDGLVADIDFSLTPFRGPAGNVEYLIAEGRDISDLRRLDRLMREGSKMEAIGQLAGGVAHDFNNVLAGIVGAAELALLRTADTEVRRRIESILSSAGRAGDLTRRLLSFARKGKMQERPLAANEVVREAVELFARSAGPDVSIERDLTTESDSISGDPSELHAAILNLCINARDAMPGGGRLRLETTVDVAPEPQRDASGRLLPPGRYIRISVTDTGCGMLPEVRERIFEPFFTTKPEGQGTGLGLPAVIGTAHAHGGGVLLRTAPGAGTTVMLLLPASGSATPGTDRQVAAAHGGGALVVLVDDDAGVRELAYELLTSLGLRVEAFGDPLLARERLRIVAGVRCVVLDLAMPRLNGRDLYQLLRTAHATLPIIVSSGYAGGGQVVGGGDDPRLVFLPKPWRVAQLRDALMRLGVLSPAVT